MTRQEQQAAILALLQPFLYNTWNVSAYGPESNSHSKQQDAFRRSHKYGNKQQESLL
jgi:hypothetical protein